MARTNHTETTGIMFTNLPTVADATYSPDDYEGLQSWHVVAYVPSTLRYYEDDVEAMDETNYDALIDALGGTVVRVEPTWNLRPDAYAAAWDALVAEAKTVGVAMVPRMSLRDWHSSAALLLVDPANEDRMDAVRDCLDSLSDYPFLDEDAYSRRESAAWDEYLPMAWRDEVRDVCSAMNREDGMNEEDDAVADFLLDHADDLAPIACGELHYWYGFSGEYGPSLLSSLVAAMDSSYARWDAFNADDLDRVRNFLRGRV